MCSFRENLVEMDVRGQQGRGASLISHILRHRKGQWGTCPSEFAITDTNPALGKSKLRECEISGEGNEEPPNTIAGKW